MKRARGCVPALLGVAALLLTGCTSDGGADDAAAPMTVQPDAAEKPEESSEPRPSLEAVIVVASVDVDGVNATASGYVGGVIEDGGECTFVFAGETHEVEVASTGAADRATTSCGSVSVPVDQLAKGQWSVRLEYQSDDAEVVSDEITMEVP